MKSLSKKNSESSYVQGSNQTKAPKPKSLTPKISASGNKKRAGVYGKSVPM
jgi:hypothetical protein